MQQFAIKVLVLLILLSFSIFGFSCQTNSTSKPVPKKNPEKTPPHIKGKRYSCVDYNLLMSMESADVRGEEFGGDTHFTNHSTNSMVSYSNSLYPTKDEAVAYFNKNKKDAKKIIRSKNLKNKNDKIVGKKILYYSETKGVAATYKSYNLIWTKDSKFYFVSSESLQAVAEIEKDCKLD